MAEAVVVRRAQRSDLAALLSMMKALAVIEGYADGFQVTTTELENCLFDYQDFEVLGSMNAALSPGVLSIGRLHSPAD